MCHAREITKQFLPVSTLTYTRCTHLELVAPAQDLVHAGEALVADLAYVQQAGRATQVHEGTVGHDRLDNALDHIADLRAGATSGALHTRAIAFHSDAFNIVYV